jgi:hypothetical protein
VAQVEKEYHWLPVLRPHLPLPIPVPLGLGAPGAGALSLGAFYRPSGSCLEISARSINFGTQAPGLADSASAKAIEARHQQWAKQLPKGEDDHWDTIVAFDGDSHAALFAHCASLSVNAVHEPWTATHGGSRMPIRSRVP